MMKHTDQIHELTVEEIARQIAALNTRKREIIEERASIYRIVAKAPPSPIVDADERAAHEHARHLLNGAAPESLSLPPEIGRDRMLSREERGIDIAIKILNSKGLAARASAAVAWAEEHRDRWHALCREIILTAIRLDALETSAQQLLGQCSDLFAISLPLQNVIGGRPISETPLGEIAERAMRENVITRTELRKAQSVD